MRGGPLHGKVANPRLRRKINDSGGAMASIWKEISTTASVDEVWAALSDVGALHTRLVPGFVVDTKLEPGARVVTFGNGMVVREAIVDIDEARRRVVWSATGGHLMH